MNRNTRKTFLCFIVALVISSAFGVAYANHPSDGGPPPAKFFTMGLSGICADQQNLYVVADGKIMQYALSDMKLLKTIDMPEPPLPPPASKEGSPCPPPPHHGGPPHGIYAGNGYFYVLLGPVIYRYTTPDLTLKDKIELPKPELPKAGK